MFYKCISYKAFPSLAALSLKSDNTNFIWMLGFYRMLVQYNGVRYIVTRLLYNLLNKDFACCHTAYLQWRLNHCYSVTWMEESSRIMTNSFFNQKCWLIWISICSMAIPHIKPLSYDMVVLCYFIIIPLWEITQCKLHACLDTGRDNTASVQLFMWVKHICQLFLIAMQKLKYISLYNVLLKTNYYLLRTLTIQVDCMKRCFKNKCCKQWIRGQV